MSDHYVHVEISVVGSGHVKIGGSVILQRHPQHPSDILHSLEIRTVANITEKHLRQMGFENPPKYEDPKREKAIKRNYLTPPEYRRLSRELIDDACVVRGSRMGPDPSRGYDEAAHDREKMGDGI